MCDVQQGPPMENKDPRIRTIVNACWNCCHRATVDPMEHETDHLGYYCIMDGCDVGSFNICKDWEKEK